MRAFAREYTLRVMLVRAALRRERKRGRERERESERASERARERERQVKLVKASAIFKHQLLTSISQDKLHRRYPDFFLGLPLRLIFVYDTI